MSKCDKNNVINLVPQKDDPDKMSSQQKRDEVVDYLIELAVKVEEGELPADQSVLIFYKRDEDDSGFQFSPRTVGLSNLQAISMCELAKDIFMRERC